MVYGLCRVMLRDADEAEDAAQQTFLSAHRSMLAGTEPRDPAAWLATIARNECRGRIRARMAAPLTLVGEDAAGSSDPEQEATRRAEVEALCGALSELPAQQRQAILLREFYGLSYDEVSTALGISLSAVESLIFRSRRRLQERLRPAQTASSALVVPAAIREALAQAAPGFPGGSGGILAAGLGKLASAPVAAKLAAAALASTAVVSATLIHAGEPRPALAAAEPHMRPTPAAPPSGGPTDALELAAVGSKIEQITAESPGPSQNGRSRPVERSKASETGDDAAEEEAETESESPAAVEDEAEAEAETETEAEGSDERAEGNDSPSGAGDGDSGGETSEVDSSDSDPDSGSDEPDD